jgi:protein-disulfide isomerase
METVMRLPTLLLSNTRKTGRGVAPDGAAARMASSCILWRRGTALFAFLLFVIAALAQDPVKDPVKLNVEDQPAFGPAGAPVTIVEFGDLECPSCRAEAPVLRQLIPELYPGKVRVVFKDYPLESIHPWARAASIAGRCVFQQNKDAFWKFYDWDYENQDDITVETLKAKVLGWARSSGINATELERCMDSKATDAEVSRNYSEGKAAGVTGTPTLFVNGRKSPSAQIPGLQKMIDAELAKK